MSEDEGYLLTYQKVSVDGAAESLRVLLPTKEFGVLSSRTIPAVQDEQVNRQLLDSLADDVIADYENRIQSRPVMVTGVSLPQS